VERPLSDEALRKYALELDPDKARATRGIEGYRDDPEKLFQMGARQPKYLRLLSLRR